jgi:hypothetical protein
MIVRNARIVLLDHHDPSKDSVVRNLTEEETKRLDEIVSKYSEYTDDQCNEELALVYDLTDESDLPYVIRYDRD